MKEVLGPARGAHTCGCVCRTELDSGEAPGGAGPGGRQASPCGGQQGGHPAQGGPVTASVHPHQGMGYLLLSDVLPLPNEKWNCFLHLCISRAWKALVNNNDSRYCTQGSADRNSPAVTCL